MPTSTLTRPLTIKPKFATDDSVALFNLKGITSKIKQAINSYPKKKHNILITVTTSQSEEIKGPHPPPFSPFFRTVNITIKMQCPTGPPDDKPPHPPRKVVLE